MVVGKSEAISVGNREVGDAISVTVSAVETVAVGVGRLSGRVGGMRVGVAGEGRLSASERNIPPMTRMMEKIAIITPPPNWRRFCIINPPCS
jgi:hypothetical protein